jgi:cytochrome b
MPNTPELALPAIESRGSAPPRWDPLVRLTHWGVAAAILVNGVISEEGSELHVWIGYAAGALLGVRLLWGLIGTTPARFSSFPPSPRRALAHVADVAAGRHRSHRSHNPLGALMVYALWGTLATVVATGVAMDGGNALAGQSVESRTTHGAPEPYERAYESRERGGESESEEMLEEIHEVAANLLFLLAGLHVAGVVFETLRGERGLVRGMITGQRRPPDDHG